MTFFGKWRAEAQGCKKSITGGSKWFSFTAFISWLNFTYDLAIESYEQNAGLKNEDSVRGSPLDVESNEMKS